MILKIYLLIAFIIYVYSYIEETKHDTGMFDGFELFDFLIGYILFTLLIIPIYVVFEAIDFIEDLKEKRKRNEN